MSGCPSLRARHSITSAVHRVVQSDEITNATGTRSDCNALVPSARCGYGRRLSALMQCVNGTRQTRNVPMPLACATKRESKRAVSAGHGVFSAHGRVHMAGVRSVHRGRQRCWRPSRSFAGAREARTLVRPAADRALGLARRRDDGRAREAELGHLSVRLGAALHGAEGRDLLRAGERIEAVFPEGLRMIWRGYSAGSLSA